MPVLPCPLGARCHDGEDGGTWKTVDIPYEQAKELLAEHVKLAHPTGGGASDAPPQQPRPGNNVNVNKGVQGGNVDNCDLQNPIFNLHTQGPGRVLSQNYQIIRFIGKGSFEKPGLLNLRM